MMDIVVDGRTYSVNLNLPKIQKQNQPEAQGTDFAAMVKEQQEVKAEILDKGFAKYVSDMQQEKLEKEIREKILNALGLSEEQYKQLPAEQRAAIEKAVQEAIQQEMQARSQEHNQENKDKSGVSVPLVAGLSF
ncbi:hypothetical protein RYZ26_14890 [Terasakiella sp. A23]|uniref:hypothetical protein n=1 Tax=Terasakiella sp. FCG-A23 TaxID=3080561 RepID=UPI002952FD12|nr:hypothetical protein [Terasakiella sp. A23]MDV7340891.1 hypothetical protein [Terasakiella sp. A23]